MSSNSMPHSVIPSTSMKIGQASSKIGFEGKQALNHESNVSRGITSKESLKRRPIWLLSKTQRFAAYPIVVHRRKNVAMPPMLPLRHLQPLDFSRSLKPVSEPGLSETQPMILSNDSTQWKQACLQVSILLRLRKFFWKDYRKSRQEELYDKKRQSRIYV